MLLMNGGFPGIFLFETLFLGGRNEHTPSTFHAKSEDLVAVAGTFLRENVDTSQRSKGINGVCYFCCCCMCVCVLIDMVGGMGCINFCWSLIGSRRGPPILGALGRVKWDPENFRGVDRLVKYYD